jgi:endonuclease/exonuclease/phosphatase family metal-dependent hydrolase
MTAAGGAGGGGGDGGHAPVSLRVMNWNVHDFFNDKDDSAAPDEVIETTADYKAHLAAVSAVVKAINPDILVLQEVENAAVLADLNAAVGNYAYPAMSNGNDPRGINIGALSRVPFDKIVTHHNDTFSVLGTSTPTYEYARDCFELHFTVNKKPLVLLGVHLKSKVMNDDGQKRLAEAQHTRAIGDALTKANPNLLLMMLGDFNDEPGSPPVAAAEGMGASAYVDAADAIALAERYTYVFDKQNELIDHQLRNAALTPMFDPKSAGIRHGPDVSKASDHAPLFATYVIP